MMMGMNSRWKGSHVDALWSGRNLVKVATSGKLKKKTYFAPDPGASTCESLHLVFGLNPHNVWDKMWVPIIKSSPSPSTDHDDDNPSAAM